MFRVVSPWSIRQHGTHKLPTCSTQLAFLQVFTFEVLWAREQHLSHLQLCLGISSMVSSALVWGLRNEGIKSIVATHQALVFHVYEMCGFFRAILRAGFLKTQVRATLFCWYDKQGMRNGMNPINLPTGGFLYSGILPVHSIYHSPLIAPASCWRASLFCGLKETPRGTSTKTGGSTKTGVAEGETKVEDPPIFGAIGEAKGPSPTNVQGGLP